MNKIKNAPLPKVLFYTAEPVLALEAQALHLSYSHEFNIMCKRQFSELKSALENYFYEVLFLDLSHLNDPISIINIINKLSPATVIYLIDSASGIHFDLLKPIVNQCQFHRIISRPFNFNLYIDDIKDAVKGARAYHKNLYATPTHSTLLTDDLPNVILLHPNFHFGAKVRQICEDLAQISWAANLQDLGVLLKRGEYPWAIITADHLPIGDCLHACSVIHQSYPNITFGMVAQESGKDAIIKGVNHFALQHVGTEEDLLQDIEAFLTPLIDEYENNLNQPYLLSQSAAFVQPRVIDNATKDFLDDFNANAGRNRQTERD